MGKPHKHSELIKLWADGAEIQLKGRNGEWIDIFPDWQEKCEYRIKPEQKPDEVHFYQALFDDLDAHRVNAVYANLKLTFDGETGELKDAEVLK